MRKIRRAIVVGICLLASLLMPDTWRISSGAVQLMALDGSGDSCQRLDLWNVPRLEITTTLKVFTRPAEYAVVWSSTLDYEEGLAVTMDRYGSLFLSVPSAQWGAKNPVVFLISEPFDFGTHHVVTVVAESGAIVSVRVDGADVEIRSLDGTVHAFDQILKTAVNRLCVGRSTIRPVAGDVGLSVRGGAAPRTFQLVLLRVMFMVLSLVLFLRTEDSKRKRKTAKEEEGIH